MTIDQLQRLEKWGAQLNRLARYAQRGDDQEYFEGECEKCVDEINKVNLNNKSRV